MESTYLAVESMSHARGGRGGVVINVASMGGKLQLYYYNIFMYSVHLYTNIVGIFPMSFAPNYCASKHGIVGFTRSMTVRSIVYT